MISRFYYCQGKKYVSEELYGGFHPAVDEFERIHPFETEDMPK